MKHFTVWKFMAIVGGAETLVVREAEPNDLTMQHEYQKVIWRGWTEDRATALEEAEKPHGAH